MKKILSIVLVCLIVLSLVGCSAETTVVSVNVENNESLNGNALGKAAMVKIGNWLWCDSTTRIVYWWNGPDVHPYCISMPSPYYAPNGLPYLYNPENNTFEEIER